MANEHLIKSQFKKGQSGNPKGRIKGSKNRSTIVKELLALLTKHENPITGNEEWLTNEHHMTISILQKAIKGDVNAYKELMNSAYGTAKDSLDLNTSEVVDQDFKKLIGAIRFKQ